MYTLRTGSDLGGMIRQYPEVLQQELGGAPSLLVIQSSVMQNWLKQELASSQGVALLPRCMTPDAAWRLFLQNLDPTHAPANNQANPDPGQAKKQEALFLDDLILLCYRELKDIRRQIASPSPERDRLLEIYEPVLPWMGYALESQEGQTGRELVRMHQADQLFTLANECAGAFFSYAQNPLDLPGQSADSPCPRQLLDLWQSPSPHEPAYCTSTKAAFGAVGQGFLERMEAHEAWQADLFRRIRVHPEARSSSSILGLLMAQAVRQNQTYRGPWKKIVLFGSSFLSRQAFDFIHWLANPEGAAMDVHHFLFLPAPLSVEGSPAFAWGRLARDILAHMERQGLDLGKPQTPEQPPAPDSDLARVRRACESGQAMSPLLGDGSFLMVSGPGMAREIETLKGMILDRLADPSNKLNCTDILVMAPDISPYRPYIEAVFGSPSGFADQNLPGSERQTRLPWNMVDLSLQGCSDYLAALRQILDLGRKRWERETLFTLLDNPCFHTRHGFGVGEREDFLRFAEQNMVRWGLDGKHRESLGGGSTDSQSWNAAFERFCLDLPLGSEAETDRDDQDSSYGQTQASGFGALYQVLHGLAQRFQSWKSRELGLEEWIQLHRALMDEFLACPTKRDEKHAEAARSTLNNLSNLLRPGREAMRSLKLDWFTFLRFFQDQLDQVEDGLGHHLTNGITFSSLRPYRAVSFPLIVVLGLNEGEFPRTDAPQPFDLGAIPEHLRRQLEASPLGDMDGPSWTQKIDSLGGGRPGAEVQDTYTWLETLYSAKQALWLFYQGKDPYTGKIREPSPLLTWIRLKLDTDSKGKVCQTIPILPFQDSDPGKAFMIDSRLGALMLTGSIAAGTDELSALPAQAMTAPSRPQELRNRSISLAELARAFTHPLRAYAKHRLSIKPPSPEDSRQNSVENLSPEFLQVRSWLQDELRRDLETAAAPETARLFQAARNRDRFYPGSMDQLNRRELTQRLGQIWEGAQEVSARVGGSPSGTATGTVFPPLEKLPESWLGLELGEPPETWQAWHQGPVAWKSAQGGLAYVIYADKDTPKLVEGSSSKKKKSTKIDDRFDAFAMLLPAIFAHALGSRRTQTAHAVAVSGKSGAKTPVLSCTLPARDDSFVELARRSLAWVLDQPRALYPELIQELMEARLKNNNLKETWENYWFDFAQGESSGSYSPDGQDSVSDRPDKPDACPYLPLVFPQSPPWPDGLEDLIDQFYLPLSQEIWNTVWLPAGITQEDE